MLPTELESDCNRDTLNGTSRENPNTRQRGCTTLWGPHQLADCSLSTGLGTGLLSMVCQRNGQNQRHQDWEVVPAMGSVFGSHSLRA